MKETRDLYQVLGVAKTAPLPEIKQAHRDLVRKYHPDHNPSLEAREIFRQGQKAYEILADPVKRQEYDYGRKSAVTDKPKKFLSELWAGIFSQGLVSPEKR